jgi:putative glutamine amidotransferase
MGQLDYFWLLSRLTEKKCSSVRSAGGIPILLTLTEDGTETEKIASRIDDGFCAAGRRYHPVSYGEPVNGPCRPNLLTRDKFEISLLKKTMEAREKPVLGYARPPDHQHSARRHAFSSTIPDVRPEWSMHTKGGGDEGYVTALR